MRFDRNNLALITLNALVYFICILVVLLDLFYWRV